MVAFLGRMKAIIIVYPTLSWTTTNDFTKRIWLSPGVILELSPTHGSHGYGESDARHDEKGHDVFPDSIFPQ
jgi:hypothetical protein